MAVPWNLCTSKLLALFEMMGMSSKGFFVFNVRMVFWRTGPGIKMADHSNPTRPFSSGAGIFGTSSAELHPARSWTNGTTMLKSVNAILNPGGCKLLEGLDRACRQLCCWGEFLCLQSFWGMLKSLGIPTPRNPHYQALVISLVWPTPLSYPVTKYLASQEYNRDIPLATTIQE